MHGCVSSAGTETLLVRLRALPKGYSEGWYDGRRFRAAVSVSRDGRRWKLYAEELGGRGRVSCNLYVLDSGVLLKPCEMPATEVLAFAASYTPDGMV
ncbi:hypothetical protein BXY53_2261 [Dichotomicrobium thermohalophilum]|uniref:Uncharacterized protein n=1 Tax=Dichotomicrobium thermohalophilum TaxID=933063 RepID=A0A397PK90_9HYPH|nr:hypothetical protein BXY53_2261 [Dichotomicrobium thermohalophilum]